MKQVLRSTELWPWLGAALLLLSVPVLNGYPLVYSDTGTYLRTAFEGYVPPDRPVWYGLFLRWTSLNGTTLWGPVVVQCLLTAFVAVRSLRSMVPHPLEARLPVLLLGLVLFTGIGWYAGQLMPDIFTGIGIASLLQLLLGRHGPVGQWTWALILLLSLALHAGNAPILLLLCLGLAPVVLRSGRGHRMRLIGVLSLVLVGWWLPPLAASWSTGAPSSRPAHVFLMGRLIDSGVLPELLQERCPGSGWELCAWKDSLPNNSQDFLWNPESPVYAMGGWAATRQEYGLIVKEALTTPGLTQRFISNTLAGTVRQLTDLHIGNGLLGTWYASPESPPFHQIEKHVPHELSAFRSSVMNRDEMRARSVLRLADMLLWLGWLLTAGALVAIAARWDRLAVNMRILVLAALMALVANALVCAGVSTVADRFQTRMSWVLPLLVWPLAVDLLQRRQR
ncbi:MAG: hypothetical protein H6593_10245 [Flavobacteriales bacterium]|nr:hypothetical protein [Flavobacteriales bacterium]